MGVEAFKIGSGELTDLPTLKVISKFGKPMILSTGMAEWGEIDETVNTLRPLNEQIILMNCVSEYPARYSDINLGVIRELQERYDLTIGHSDHTPDIYTSIAAVAMSASSNSTTNQNIAPEPGSLMTPISPCISSTSFRLMASPRPVPPN